MIQKKLLVLGATGGTGRHFVSQALDAGHAVTAFVRSPEKLQVRHDSLRLVTGSVTQDSAMLADAVRGQDAVISALGRGSSLKSANLIEQSVPAILSGMRQHGVRRLIFTSAIGVGDAIRDVPLFARIMARVLLKDLYADKVIGENLIRQSGLDWTIVQPAQLTNGRATGKYQFGEGLKQRGMPKISRADVADFLLRQVADVTCIRKIVALSY